MLASLLPGLRDLRTPLATGYLWVIVLWLLLHNHVPISLDQTDGPVKSLYQLGTLVGNTAVLAAVSFVAYLLGSMLRFQAVSNFSGLVVNARHRNKPLSKRNSIQRGLDRLQVSVVSILRNRLFAMRLQLETFVSTRVRESLNDLGLEDQIDFLEVARSEWLYRLREVEEDIGDTPRIKYHFWKEVPRHPSKVARPEHRSQL